MPARILTDYTFVVQCVLLYSVSNKTLIFDFDVSDNVTVTTRVCFAPVTMARIGRLYHDDIGLFPLFATARKLWNLRPLSVLVVIRSVFTLNGLVEGQSTFSVSLGQFPMDAPISTFRLSVTLLVGSTTFLQFQIAFFCVAFGLDFLNLHAIKIHDPFINHVC